MRLQKYIITIIAILPLLACTQQPSDEERARVFLDSAQTLYQINHLEAAKLQLDSVHQNFPKLVNFRRQADTLAWKIEMREIERNLIYVDSLLPLKANEVNSLTKPFTYEKDVKFEQYGTFTYKILLTECNLERNYVKPYTDETGQLFITAHYCGKPIDYTRIRMSANGVFAESLVAESSDKHTFTDLGITHETVLFRPDFLGSLPDFWTTHQNEKVVITYEGNRDYSYALSKQEMQAFIATYQLATILSDVTKLKELQRHSLVRQAILNKKLNQKE